MKRVTSVRTHVRSGRPVRSHVRLDPIVEQNQYGAWVVSDIINNQRVHRQYYGYPKREAIRRFKEEFQ